MVRDTRLWYINLDSPLVLITPHNRCIMQPTTDGLWWQYWGGLSVVSSSSQYSQGINTPPNHYQNDYKATNPNQKDSLSSNLSICHHEALYRSSTLPRGPLCGNAGPRQWPWKGIVCLCLWHWSISLTILSAALMDLIYATRTLIAATMTVGRQMAGRIDATTLELSPTHWMRYIVPLLSLILVVADIYNVYYRQKILPDILLI